MAWKSLAAKKENPSDGHLWNSRSPEKIELSQKSTSNEVTSLGSLIAKQSVQDYHLNQVHVSFKSASVSTIILDAKKNIHTNTQKVIKTKHQKIRSEAHVQK